MNDSPTQAHTGAAVRATTIPILHAGATPAAPTDTTATALVAIR